MVSNSFIKLEAKLIIKCVIDWLKYRIFAVFEHMIIIQILYLSVKICLKKLKTFQK